MTKCSDDILGVYMMKKRSNQCLAQSEGEKTVEKILLFTMSSQNSVREWG